MMEAASNAIAAKAPNRPPINAGEESEEEEELLFPPMVGDVAPVLLEVDPFPERSAGLGVEIVGSALALVGIGVVSLPFIRYTVS